MTPKNLKDLYIHQLRDLYSAESQLIEALPTMAEEASTPGLKQAYKTHLEETKGQKRRLEEIFDRMDLDPDGQTCKAMKGLIKESNDLISDAHKFFGSDAPPEVLDAGLIASAQRVEHYEIAGYGTVVTYAEMLGRRGDQDLLRQTLDEEKETDAKLNRLAKDGVNLRAERA
jgi:ferritin-like metal-binding protein YciE